MNLFLTGATGYIGGAVAHALQKGGHSVTGLARSDESAGILHLKGIAVHHGDLAKPRADWRGAGVRRRHPHRDHE